MKLSTKGRYGARAMLDLALHISGNEPVSLNSIAERQEISEQYLEQIFSALRKAGLVKSERGAQGGYRLGKSAAKITVGEILRALEGPLDLVDCVSASGKCKRYDECVMKDVWRKVTESIRGTVDSITVEDLVNDYKAKNSSDFMYYI